MQQNSLKALSEAVLQRNSQRNRNATQHKKPCNFEVQNRPEKLHTPTTIKQAIEELNRLGNWQQISSLAAELCPSLLDAAKQASRDIDNHIIGIDQYYQAWLAVFSAAQRLSERMTAQ